PLYLGICFLFHPWIGIAATIGALILVSLAFLTEARTRRHVKEASGFGAQRMVLAEASRRNAEVRAAMGMAGQLGMLWREANAKYMASHQRAADVAGGLGALSKALRLLPQSGVLRLGPSPVLHP